jgi:hypothetical protein
MGLADLLQAPERKSETEPKSDTHYMKEDGLSSIFAVTSMDELFPVHGFDQCPVLRMDGFAFHLHRRCNFTVFGVEFLVKDHKLADVFHPRQLIVDLVDFFLNQFKDFLRVIAVSG